MIITNNKEQGSEYYDAIYAPGYDTLNYQQIYKIILEAIQEIESPRVLEIGCGIGDLGKMIVDSGIPYRGFDFSEEAVRRSRVLCSEGDFRVGNAYDKENYFPADYNIAVALEVLEHLDDFKVIENLPPGTHMLASVPDFNDTAHLRIYRDPVKDIVERFIDLLDIKRMRPVRFINNDTGHPFTIHLFHGVRKEPITVDRVLAKNGPTEAAKPKIKVGRNDLCSCGSGKKYKKCCMS